MKSMNVKRLYLLLVVVTSILGSSALMASDTRNDTGAKMEKNSNWFGSVNILDLSEVKDRPEIEIKAAIGLVKVLSEKSSVLRNDAMLLVNEKIQLQNAKMSPQVDSIFIEKKLLEYQAVLDQRVVKSVKYF